MQRKEKHGKLLMQVTTLVSSGERTDVGLSKIRRGGQMRLVSIQCRHIKSTRHQPASPKGAGAPLVTTLIAKIDRSQTHNHLEYSIAQTFRTQHLTLRSGDQAFK
jgi:hypothetical protein